MGLVSYLGGMGWFMTLCTAALAVVDGEHSVRIESREQGFLVILGHEHLSQGSGSLHSHDWISAVLTTMAADSLTPGGDHVIDLDRDPGLVARSSEASLRDSIARNLNSVLSQPMAMPNVASSSPTLRQASLGVQSALSPSLRVSRTHVLRC